MYKKKYVDNIGCKQWWCRTDISYAPLTLILDHQQRLVSLTARLDACDAQLFKGTTTYQNQPKKNAHADSMFAKPTWLELVSLKSISYLTSSCQERKGW